MVFPRGLHPERAACAHPRPEWRPWPSDANIVIAEEVPFRNFIAAELEAVGRNAEDGGRSTMIPILDVDIERVLDLAT